MIGQHYLLDLYNIDTELAQHAEKISELLTQAAKLAKATILHTYFHKFGPKQGITGMVLLCESHISIHTWPEYAFAAIDLFMCGHTEPEKAAEFLRNAFHAQTWRLQTLHRGK